MHLLFLTVFILLHQTWGFPNNPSIVPLLDGRIVGGTETSIEEYPYQISLLFWSSHSCGGSLISKEWVVTAAHCTYGAKPSLLKVRYGSSIRNSGGSVVKVSAINEHPQFNLNTIDYDISVIKLADSVVFSESVGLVRLPTEKLELTAGKLAIVTGWGTLKEGGSLPKQLQSVRVPLISKTDCIKAYNNYKITDRMVCAGYSQGGKDSCQGDSGGPLVTDGELIGIVSWGYGCARPKYPGVYASVPALRNHITEVSGL